MATKIILHEMGEGVIEGTVSRWLKQPGDAVAKYEPVLEIETDKVTTEVTAEEGGTLLEALVPEGKTVPVGTVLAIIGQSGEEVNSSAPPAETTQTAVTTQPTTSPPAPPIVAPAAGHATNGHTQPYTGRISPVVGRIAAEHHVDLARVTGTGRDGRITKKDVLAYVEQLAVSNEQLAMGKEEPAIAPAPLPPRSPAPPQQPTAGDTLVPLTTMRRAIAEHMVRSKHTSPHVTTVFEFDFTAVAAHRAAHKARFAQDGANLTFTAYIVAATVEALKQHPMVNSIWSDDGVILKKEINIGMAAAIEEGLIVPVIKNADSLNLLGIARAVNDLTHRARHKQLKPGDVQGGTFSITNHGVSGSLFATPIINQPQCGILGTGIIEKRVKVINDAIAIRPMAFVSFTFDHRILDGATADYFVGTIKQVIENWK
ncbi:MAG: 2-oxo acid dehydrogenase subunit E2 [Ardenticatenaceae bacterium]|nr:2-oxo acid dehydrogenase subunit E2 [Ardenticatenaceae bacterium]MCB8991239.1 2-oxo acid dehydrogenase subunit E2 [Ardenticatenaceae bacterium]MCB9003720.1 2-oxo acid dehydrogenase subunit E2 [Ardenticatenaceae bacterium]